MKYLYFETDADETSGVCIPISSVVGVDIAAAGAIDLWFNDLGSSNANDGKIVINETSGTEKAVVEAIAKAIHQGAENFVTIADDTNSEYIHSSITSCGAIALA